MEQYPVHHPLLQTSTGRIFAQRNTNKAPRLSLRRNIRRASVPVFYRVERPVLGGIHRDLGLMVAAESDPKTDPELRGSMPSVDKVVERLGGF